MRIWVFDIFYKFTNINWKYLIAPAVGSVAILCGTHLVQVWVWLQYYDVHIIICWISV